MQLKELLEEVGLELDEVIGVIKFGSRVKGYFHESSDEDILVIVRSDKGGVYQKEGRHFLVISMQDFIEEVLRTSPLISAVLSGYEIVYARYPVYFWVERAEEALKKAGSVHVDKGGVRVFARS
ncbi:MAG: nucleotidyltransferase domain-containing protein [Candidatus Methanodesulfokora sp.]